MTASKSEPVQYRILPAELDDCPTIAFIENVAFDDLVKEQSESNLFRLLFGPSNEERQAFWAGNFADKLNNDPTTSILKVVIRDPDTPYQEKIIACAVWHFHVEPFKPDDWKDIEWPVFANAAACNEFIGGLSMVEKKHMHGERYGFLSVLATLPEYRGQGIASALISHGIAEGVKSGLKHFWLNGSLDGHAIYERHGFRNIEPTELNFAKYGGVGKSVVVGMRKTIE
ncbi:hypothetical protein N7492_002547 [Penicillium capsulatum]|uniref:N-acetyltransferase domain-containing protein n=1 Tax=Penicillium capsulatum TaxID=69766 RepID=A0A9W9IKB1_9EURO|nr:hypothetical protein N7492_002547 [Penicillium capsulatum]KAJ6122849.1 hypothetical protein N7512_005314 [Penicillium capsulatum]